MKKSVTRRDALRAATVVVSALVAARSGSAGAATTRRGAASRGASERSALDFAAGTQVALCTIVSVGAIEKGGIAFHLRDAQGADFLVDVLRHDADAPGVARAGSLAVYLANGGKGSKATREDHGIAAMTLAAMIAKREAAGMAVPALATQREREPLLLQHAV